MDCILWKASVGSSILSQYYFSNLLIINIAGFYADNFDWKYP